MIIHHNFFDIARYTAYDVPVSYTHLDVYKRQYVLLPLKKGNLVIKQALIEINGLIYKTLPIKITVTNAVNQPNRCV